MEKTCIVDRKKETYHVARRSNLRLRGAAEPAVNFGPQGHNRLPEKSVTSGSGPEGKKIPGRRGTLR